MKSTGKTSSIFIAAAVMLTLSATAGFAKTAPLSVLDGADVIILTENHARNIIFDLDASVGSIGGLHAIYILTSVLNQEAQGGLLQISLANTTPLTKGDEIVYFVVGFVGTTPFFQYVYASGGIFSAAAVVPKVTFGVLFTGVIYARGVDLPASMSGVVSLQAQ